MIKEILEQQGLLFGYDYEKGSRITNININQESYYYIGAFANSFNNAEEHQEYTARQYVKENGFKLEWFGNGSYIVEDILPSGTTYVVRRKVVKDNGEQDYSICSLDINKVVSKPTTILTKYSKLIAWLYANDIKVVE